MENKFYTPTIDEFHVGFDYEYSANNTMPFLDDTLGEWKGETFTASCMADGESECHDVGKLIERKQIRVKLLDREDIEAEDWKYNSVSSENLPSNNHQIRGIYSSDFTDERGNKFSLFHNISANWVLIWASSAEHTHTIWDDKLSTMGETVFAGTIRNKSELKKLMQQLQIK